MVFPFKRIDKRHLDLRMRLTLKYGMPFKLGSMIKPRRDLPAERHARYSYFSPIKERKLETKPKFARLGRRKERTSLPGPFRDSDRHSSFVFPILENTFVTFTAMEQSISISADA